MVRQRKSVLISLLFSQVNWFLNYKALALKAVFLLLTSGHPESWVITNSCSECCKMSIVHYILLEDENFNEALNVLERIKLDGIQLDVLLFNTFLRQACYKGRIDVIEFIVEFMHQEKVQPDPTTCGYVFSAYVNSSFHNTAVEALQVLSLRMMSVDGNILQERKNFVDEFILDEDLASESHIFKLFEDSEDKVAIGLWNLRWCAMIGFPIYYMIVYPLHKKQICDGVREKRGDRRRRDVSRSGEGGCGDEAKDSGRK
ncbi:hypothetical protein MTR_1g026480 [Medicago truncatula]|uniref:Uncharacterized protein n=1 Tax=Medicago truncatula TaxID=3880 RepID=A0A072VFN9_MEDTR|nr:hypothetical protein MTR_1g026480 [Medicago truncatula]